MDTRLVLYENFYSKAADRTELSKMVIRQGAPIKVITESFGLVPVITLVSIMIQGFCRQFNVSKNMNQGQIEDLAADLVLQFKDRKGNAVMMEELAVFFDRAGKDEFKKPDGKSFIFDRIDRGVIEAMMDVYFETDRTQAIWAIEDEKRIKPAGQIIPRSSSPIVLDKQGNDITPKNIYDLAGDRKFPIAKLLKQLGDKYAGETINYEDLPKTETNGGQTEPKGATGNDSGNPAQ